MAKSTPQRSRDDIPIHENDDDDTALLDIDEAGEEIVADELDHPMEDSDSDSDDRADQDSDQGEEQQQGQGQEIIQLQNDSRAHFDLHQDSIFCVALHPRDPGLVATGGGDEVAYVFRTDGASSLQSKSPPESSSGRASLPARAKLSGHSDSVNALTFTMPDGAFLVTGGLDGRLRVHSTTTSQDNYPLVAETQEVPEIQFILPCPHPSHPNTIALGASDGSVWIYTIDATESAAAPLQTIQAYYLHTEPCTAGAWTPDGTLLATVSEDSSFYVWDVFGAARAAGVPNSQNQSLVSLKADDQRFGVEGGLFSVAIAPNGAYAVVGGADGTIRVVGLPRMSSSSSSSPPSTSTKGQQQQQQRRSKKPPPSGSDPSFSGSPGHVYASLRAQQESVESLSFSSPPLTQLAAGSIDGSIVILDTAHNFSSPRHIQDAHDGHAVVKVEYSRQPGKEHLLTSCGMDGVVRLWDTRGGRTGGGGGGGAGSSSGDQGLVREWRGHRGDGEGGGVLGFVQGAGKIVTAGDDGVSLVFGD